MQFDFEYDSEESLSQDSTQAIQQYVQKQEEKIIIDYEGRLTKFCLDENISELLKFQNLKYSNMAVMTLFNVINEQIKFESEAAIRQIQPLFETSLQEYKNQNFEKAEIEISRLFKEINNLDFQKISDEINESQISSKEMNNQDVVMVLGFTGTGKSTFIHYLAGSKIQQIINKDGLHHWEPTNFKYKALDRVISKPDAKSETKFATLVRINTSDQEGNEYGEDEEINLCDTPGFLDTQGNEAEIANLTGIYECISVCKSIKPIILISEQQISDRGSGIKSLANVIKKMVKPSQNFQQLIRKFIFVFSKFSDKKSQEQLHKKLQNIYENLNAGEKKDQEFISVLKAMLQQTQDEKNIAFFDLSIEGYKFIEKHIIGRQAIEMPKDAFTCFFTSEAETSISQQLKQDQSRIQTAWKKRNFLLIFKKLTQLNLLKNSIQDLSSFSNQWEQNLTQIDDQINSEIQSVDQFVQKIIEFKKIDEEQITNFLNTKQELSKLNILYKLLPQTENLVQKFNGALREAILAILQNVKQDLISCQQNNVNEYYQKLLFLSDIVKEENSITVFISYMMENISNQVKKAESFLQQDNFADFFNEMQQIINYIESCTFLPAHNVKDQIVKAFDKVILEMENSKLTIFEKIKQQTVKKNEENDRDIQNAKEKIHSIHQEFKKSNLKDEHCKEKINNFQKEYREQIEKEYQDIEEKVKAVINDESSELQVLKSRFIQLQLLSKLYPKLDQKFKSLVSLINSRIAKMSKKIKQVVKELQITNNSEDELGMQFQNLEEAFYLIQECQWIQEIDQDQEYDSQKQKILNSMKNFANIIIDQLDQLEIGLEQTEDLKKIASSKQKMKKLNNFSHYDEVLKQSINQYDGIVMEKFQYQFNKIKNFSEQQNTTFWERQKSYQFLNKCISNQIYKKEAQQMLEDVKKNLINSCLEKEKSLKQSFEQLQNIFQNTSLSSEERQLIENCSKNIYDKFEEMSKIEKFSELKDILDQDKSNFSISQQLSGIKRIQIQLQEIVDMNEYVEYKWIFILQKLKILDELQSNSQNSFCFSDLLSKTYKKNKFNVEQLKSGFDKQLSNNYLPQMLATYKKLQGQAMQNKENKENQMVLEDFKFQLENQMQKIIIQIKQQVDKLSQHVTFLSIDSQIKEQIDYADQIINSYKQFNDYDYYFKDYLDVDKFKSEIEQINKIIYQVANEGLKKIQQMFKNYYFKEFNVQYQFMQEVFKILMQKFEIKEQFNQLESGQIKEYCFKELQQKVENLNLDNSKTEIFDLNLICGKLEKVQDNEIYLNLSKQLQDIFQKKLEDKLKQANEKSLSQFEKTIKEVQSFFGQIPNQMKNSLSQLIENINKTDKIKEQMNNFYKQKNIIEIIKLLETLKDSSLYTEFKNRLDNFIENEIQLNYNEIILNDKKYINFEKSFQNLIRIAVNTAQTQKYLDQVKEKLNNVFEQLFCDKIKEAGNKIQNVLSQKVSNHQTNLEFFSDYCCLGNCLLKVYHKLQEQELKILKELEYFYVFDQIQIQQQLVITNLKPIVRQIQHTEEDFSCIYDQFKIAYQLQYFDCESYHELIENLKSKQQKLNNQVEQILQKDVNKFTIQKEYEDYYHYFQKVFQNAKQMQILVQQFNIISQKITLFEDLLQKLNQIIKSINYDLKQCFQGDIFDDSVVKSINNIYLNSKYIDQYFSSMGFVENSMNQRFVQSEFLQQIQKQFTEPKQIDKIEQFTEYISNMHKISSTYIYMEKIKTECNEKINQALKNYKDFKGSLEKLQIQLRKSKYGDQVTQNHPFFKGFQISDTNLRIQRFGIDQVLEQVRGYSDIDKKDDINKTQLNNFYQRFINEYNQYLDKYLTSFEKINFIDLLKEIQNSVNKINKDAFNKTGKIEQTSQIIVADLLAGIFCCWTCINSKYYFESIDQSYENKQSFLLKPHPSQIVAIFRLLGIGYSKNYDEIQCNSLAQVLTGEGKSVVLAALACFYSLCGFSVKCACYSNQLSVRDYQEFLLLFEKLKIKDLIQYGTFNKVCEEILNQRGDIREQVSSYIQTENIKYSNNSNIKKQVLLIDEVDVFFSKDFFGNNYDIVAPIQDQTIESLLDKIWNAKHDPNFSFKYICKSQEYKNCIAQFPNWIELIKEQTKIAVSDFKNINKVSFENYKIQNDKIYYKNQDQYLDNISYGYRTLYTYYQENQNSKISNVGLQKQKVFKINSGSFCYSELPKKFFIINGVTGTLETLSQSQLQLIQNTYNMKQYTFIPSIYGKSKFQFNPQKDVKVVSQSEYYNTITNEINKNIVGKTDQKRAVLVFFDTKKTLHDYYNSQQFKSLKQNSQIQIMTEENQIEERKKIIKDATYSGAITLLTKIFGRGIDFQVNDTIIFQNYGVHVIQTFFSEDKSEETQIKGRTARQGEEGSFSMVLQQDTLQAFLKTEEDQKKIENLDEIYEVLDRNRQVNFENDFKSNIEYNQKTSITSHKQSEDFLNFLKDCNQQEVKKYLLQLNQGPKENTFKTLIAMDVTGSMSNLITQTKNTIQTTFEQTRDILTEKGYDPQCFQIMISCFRSYNSKWEEIFQTSTWENNPDKLRSFLQKITASGGTWPGESVEVGLWWANKQNDEDPISQVIILGDQPAHLMNEAQKFRNQFGQSYWDTTPLKGLTYYVPECQKLKNKNIPVNTFYLKQGAKSTFENIAKLTNGISQYLDINSGQSSKQLTTLFVEQILKDIGKQDGCSNELISAYKAKYS
ncbi:helicase carboxy-terminal domain protein (macronuclear) [Tetrahymena thermophila SB210]|uniref:Helicase carboxy-terminal domain protein n=1 Tax=Tetrahymena thermophila (strain SB210) TaxID=312017 RepID=Q23FJ8_TETTS|nr:helicase carboxy-terminal domain protein [Tetrahymena thermophila SB210]EAR95155.1 helicase carboxy-terminal domain protein [Tetrahymena thermophila SB210]|eukprot:XP_001015400.1 helicase carboxy-terminal domain protein [Tetrahymena thermophila SB210]